jgi:hypothetical protein
MLDDRLTWEKVELLAPQFRRFVPLFCHIALLRNRLPSRHCAFWMKSSSQQLVWVWNFLRVCLSLRASPDLEREVERPALESQAYRTVLPAMQANSGDLQFATSCPGPAPLAQYSDFLVVAQTYPMGKPMKTIRG